ncbi:Hypothetical protein CAP_8194 [Chondromyces apiculatus DSM 436]|uniref:Uncharacterized protein n=1 Tax=Chondromyces apiculatus DSM 436 TaxID=1192034 RepID=A0A017TEH7_9BACT|nr:Hypothetical protein CAP_8194 [Chondromyces apiculatus DSM 436]
MDRVNGDERGVRQGEMGAPLLGRAAGIEHLPTRASRTRGVGRRTP